MTHSGPAPSLQPALTRRGALAMILGGVALCVLPDQGYAGSAALQLRYGWQADQAGPTQANFYTSPDGDDQNAGTLQHPFRTIQRGIDALSQLRGGSLAIRGGTYRESVSLDVLRGTAAAPFLIHRYGTEPVTITAAEPLTGWQSVSDAEAQALGTQPKGLFKATLPLSRMEHGYFQVLNIHENGVLSPPAIDRAVTDGPPTPGDRDTFYQTNYILDAKGQITALRDPRLKGVPQQQLHQVQVLLYHSPNLISAQDIAGFDPATGTIELSNKTRKPHKRSGKPIMRYALRNVGWALGPGQWVARMTQRDEVTVYLRPLSQQSLAQGIEYSARPFCVDFGRAAHTELFGLNAIRAAGVERFDGVCIRRKGSKSQGEGLALTHCRAGENVAFGRRGYGAICLRGTARLKLRWVTVAQTRNSFGLALLEAVDADMRFLHIHDVSQSPGRFFGLRDSVFAFSLLENSAYDAHANKFNFYEGSDNVLVYGIRTRNVRGYATFQEASRIHFAFCELNSDAKSNGRALVSQNRRAGRNQGGADGSGEPVSGTTFYIWNNCLPPDPAKPDRANSLILGPGSTSQHFAIFNNVLHGGGFADIYRKGAPASKEQRAGNRYTGFSFWQKRGNGWQLAQTEQAMRPGTKVSGQGIDMRPIIRKDLAAAFPGFTDWDKDIDGRPIDWNNPPVGCNV